MTLNYKARNKFGLQESCCASGVCVGISNFRYTVGLFDCLKYYLLANVNSRSRSPYAIARPSVCRPSVCRLERSCALLRRFKFSAIFLRH